MKNPVPIISCLLFFIALYSCTHKPQIPIAAVNTNTNTNTTNTNTNTNTNNTDTTTNIIDTSVCFQRDVLPIFTGYCAKSGCHDAASAKDGYNLSSYATIIARGLVKGNAASSKIYTECTKGKMPESPTPKLDSTQLSLMSRWINMGAPNDTDCPVICDTTKFTFAAAIVPILSKNCYSCHASAVAPGSGGGIILDNYNGVLAEAQNGKLPGDLQHLSGYNFMPLNGAQLPTCEITQINKWITAGAQNN
jgi:uncharacterized membrane protein